MCTTANTRQTMCLPCAAARGTRQTVNNILCINPIIFSLQVYLLNKLKFLCNYFVKLTSQCLFHVYKHVTPLFHVFISLIVNFLVSKSINAENN